MRRALQPGVIASGYAAVFKDRQTIGYMIASTFLTACLFGYITASEQIYVDVFALGPAFPIAFAAIAITISIGTFLNSRIVVGQGMRRISHVAMFWFTGIAAVHAAAAMAGLENFWSFIILLGLSFGVFGLMSSNFNTLAMERMGHVAGSASAVFGAVTATGGALLGGVIARAFDGTTSPFVTAVALAGVGIILSVLITERGRLMRETP
jgi:DHA1 family bicyclomycin/chloramphenicol resistance-like MFS transporter